MSSSLHKVTAFIVRPCPAGQELLLFRHPFAGVQIPAGTVEIGENPEQAALREAGEETGLSDLRILRSLGTRIERPPAGCQWTAARSKVYSRSDGSGFDWAHLRSGLTVRVLRQAGSHTLVSYEEPDRFPNPRYITYQITGWVPTQALTDQRERHFFLLSGGENSPAHWKALADNHVMELFWAPLNQLPELVSTQAEWLAYLPKEQP